MGDMAILRFVSNFHSLLLVCQQLPSTTLYSSVNTPIPVAFGDYYAGLYPPQKSPYGGVKKVINFPHFVNFDSKEVVMTIFFFLVGWQFSSIQWFKLFGLWVCDTAPYKKESSVSDYSIPLCMLSSPSNERWKNEFSSSISYWALGVEAA